MSEYLELGTVPCDEECTPTKPGADYEAAQYKERLYAPPAPAGQARGMETVSALPRVSANGRPGEWSMPERMRPDANRASL